MLKRILVLLVVTSLLVSSCAYDVTKGDYENEDKYFERISNLCRNEKEITLTTTDFEQIVCSQILLTNESTSFVRIESDTVEMIPTIEVYCLSFPNKTAGFEGFLIGGLSGGIIGNFLTNPSQPENIVKGMAILSGIVIGGLIGLFYAVASKSETMIYITK